MIRQQPVKFLTTHVHQNWKHRNNF